MELGVWRILMSTVDGKKTIQMLQPWDVAEVGNQKCVDLIFVGFFCY